MTNRALWITLVALAVVVALGVGAFAAHESLESKVEVLLAEIRAATPSVERRRSPEGRELYARLDGIDRWVRDNAVVGDRPHSPWLQSAEDVVDSPGGLEPLEPFFEQVDALASSEACRKFLERDEYLSMPTRRLLLARTCTNLLCERAWIDQCVVGDGVAAARRLGQALDLARLGDDGSAIGFMIDIANEQIVLSATQVILLDPRCDARVLHEALDAKLARMRDPDRLRRTLVQEFETFREHVPGRSTVRLENELRYLEALERALDLAELHGSEAEAALRPSGSAADPYASAVSGIVKSWHLARTRTELGRAALALAAGIDAPLPTDPYSNAPFVRETTPSGERICSPAAIATLGDSNQPYLLVWTLPR